MSGDSAQAQYEITVNHEMAGLFGLSEVDITRTISVLIQGYVAVSVFLDPTKAEARVVPGGPVANEPNDLEGIQHRLPSGEYVPLSATATLSPNFSQSLIERQGGTLAVSIQANLPDGVGLGTAVVRVDDLATETLLQDMGVVWGSQLGALSRRDSRLYF